MGASCAPSYANLFLGLWERQIFLTDPIFLADHVQFWWRYIDDVLFIWQGSLTDLELFMECLNDNDRNIKLTWSYSRTKIEFLDIALSVDINGYIQTDLYRKPTSSNALLHYKSAHPRYVVNNIPTGQFLRARRICSTENSFEQSARDLELRFKQRGYNQRSIQQGYQRARLSNRSDLIRKRKMNVQRSSKDTNKTLFLLFVIEEQGI
ncbi:uncharacterized protein RB166_009651 [Leptodactylus fuscus]